METTRNDEPFAAYYRLGNSCLGSKNRMPPVPLREVAILAASLLVHEAPRWYPLVPWYL